MVICENCNQSFINPYKWEIRHCLECGQDLTQEQLEILDCERKCIDYKTYLERPIYTQEQFDLLEQFANDPDFAPEQQQHYRDLITNSRQYEAEETTRRAAILKKLATAK